MHVEAIPHLVADGPLYLLVIASGWAKAERGQYISGRVVVTWPRKGGSLCV